MPARSTKAGTPATPPDPTKLKRESAGRYVSGDGRFSVEQSSGGWMVSDAEQSNELGLPLVRGPFATLDEARAAMTVARRGPAPISSLTDRIAARRAGARSTATRAPAGAAVTTPPPRPEPPPIVVREYRSGDGPPLRALWDAVGFRSLGDDDASLRALAQRNPGMLLVAVRGTQAVGSAMGGWDGRRGWIYHVATMPDERRSGLATRLVRQIEARLEALGCKKVNVIVRDGNADGAAFWEALGYSQAPARQFGRELSG
ncbi:MAG: GNAT family N-acetyltransferase [Chloroflexota bacterium]|nr:MAG: GNAT family N-acetyltransferase [Chloroflexota bacterium]